MSSVTGGARPGPPGQLRSGVSLPLARGALSTTASLSVCHPQARLLHGRFSDYITRTENCQAGFAQEKNKTLAFPRALCYHRQQNGFPPPARLKTGVERGWKLCFRVLRSW